MKISDLIRTISSQYLADPATRVSIFAQGAPGLGKSDAPRQAARELTAQLGELVEFRDLQATIEDPITLSGLPARAMSTATTLTSRVNNPRQPLDEAVFLPFRDKLPTAGRGILCIDEINTAPPVVQAGLYSLFLSGKLGSYQLPAGWYVMATGNRDEDRAATSRIPMPLIGRWCRVKVESDLADWTRWALANGVRTDVVAFFQFRPDLFNTFDPTRSEPYSCPRTAVFASSLLATAPAGLEHEMLCGVLGDGVATELTAFVRVFRQLPSVQEILLNPDKAPVPDAPEVLYAIAGAVAAKASAGNFGQVVRYIDRLPREFGVLTVKMATARDRAICTAHEFAVWAADKASILAGS